MEIQICPFCKKEFMPPRDGRSHTYCNRKCRVDHYKQLREEDKVNRKEMGLPQKRSVSSLRSHLYGEPYDL